MNCRWAREQTPAYINGELDAVRTWFLRLHLCTCAECFDRYENEEGLRDMLQLCGPVSVPRHLATRLKLAVTRKEVQLRMPAWKVHLKNALRPLAVPVTGGVLVAVLSFAGLMSNLGFVPRNLGDDVPLRVLAEQAVSAPSLTSARALAVTRDIVVEAFVDYRGQVYDYRVLRMPTSSRQIERELRAQLANALLSVRFEPATSFGRPVLGRALIFFRPVTSVTVYG